MQTSCGFGVPLLTTAQNNSEDSETQGEIKPVLLDRDTIGHWSRKKVENNELLDYQAEWNSSSIDGCPGLRSAMRDHGDTVWLALAKARVRRIAAQREALFFGIVMGMVLLLVVNMLMGQLRGPWPS